MVKSPAAAVCHPVGHPRRAVQKSRKSHRVVPVPPEVVEGLSVLLAYRPRDALVFIAPEGGPVGDMNFRNRVWWPAMAAAGIRRFPPRIMRHTAASWLVMDRGAVTLALTHGAVQRDAC